MGSFEDHLLGGTVDIPAGNVKRLRKACEGLVGVGTATEPVTIRLAAGTYTLDRYLSIPNYCTIIGQGRDSTVIRRDVSLVNTPFGSGISLDPVLDLSGSQSVTLECLSVIHSGVVDTTSSTTTRSPCAIVTGGAKRLKLSNVRLEGTYAGWADISNSYDSSFSKPIPDDVIGNEDYQYFADNCIVIGHQVAGVANLARHEFYANGCVFMCDVRASDVLSTQAMPVGLDHWEYAIGYYKSCEFIVRVAQTLIVSNSTLLASALAIRDTSITDTVAYLDNCTLYVDLSEGDINSASSGAASLYVNGTPGSGAVIYPSNVVKANNCIFRYETGTITSAQEICGLYIDSQSGVSTALDVYLNSCSFEDISGSGGTRRRDVVIAGRLGNVQPRRVEVRNCNIQDYDYRNITGSPVYTHANFMTEPNTMNYQRSSVTLSGGSAAATLPLAFTASAGITDYFVGLEGPTNEVFWWGSKTNSGFTVFSSNTNSTAAVKFVVRR